MHSEKRYWSVSFISLTAKGSNECSKSPQIFRTWETDGSPIFLKLQKYQCFTRFTGSLWETLIFPLPLPEHPVKPLFVQLALAGTRPWRDKGVVKGMATAESVSILHGSPTFVGNKWHLLKKLDTLPFLSPLPHSILTLKTRKVKVKHSFALNFTLLWYASLHDLQEEMKESWGPSSWLLIPFFVVVRRPSRFVLCAYLCSYISLHSVCM